MSHPIGAGGPAGAHPIDEHHRRRGAWWWWLLALLVLLLVALLIVLLVRHNSDDGKTAATPNKVVPSASGSTSASPGSPSVSENVPSTSAAASSDAAGPATASPATAAASCLRPALTVDPQSARPGQRVVLIGRHFSGCRASTGHATPTTALPVRIGAAGQHAVTRALTTARTSRTGYFRVELTVPAAAGGVKTVLLAAASRDLATTLGYYGTSRITYATTAGKSGGSDNGSGTAGPGGAPTAVPAGSGGQAAATSPTVRDQQLALLIGGLVLTVGAVTVLARRRGSRR